MYGKDNMKKTNGRINDEKYTLPKSKTNDKDFTRNRKLNHKDLILYNLNNRGLTTKMELENFIETCNNIDVSAPALLKQRAKLNHEIFIHLNNDSMKDFYNDYKSEVKTFKNYLLTAIDGSDCEVPNTSETRKRYQATNSSNENRVARIKLSNCFDVLNKFILDTQVFEYKHSENDLANKHTNNIKKLVSNFKTISIRDRGYFSLEYFYTCLKNKDLFVVRLREDYLKLEQNEMNSNDEFTEIKYQYDRIRKYKDKNKEIYDFYENGGRIKIRITKIVLITGEVELIMSNLPIEEFTTEDIKYIYNSRWGIESNYDVLKNSMKITNISSSKDNIIKQEIFSTVFACNLLQGIVNDEEQKIEQEKYKYKMKINFNMAVGFFKKYLILILIEVDNNKKERLSEDLFVKIMKNLVPIRTNRSYPREKDKKNSYPINKRKAY